MAKQSNPKKRLERYKKRHKALAAELAKIGFIWPGNIQHRMITCGKPTCACKKDPRARHGPYHYWTTKVDQKTVAERLSEDEAGLYEEWIENRRHLESVIAQLKAISQKAAKTAVELRRLEKGAK